MTRHFRRPKIRLPSILAWPHIAKTVPKEKKIIPLAISCLVTRQISLALKLGRVK